MVFLNVRDSARYPRCRDSADHPFSHRNIPLGVFVIAIVLLFVPFKQSSNDGNEKLSLHTKLHHMDAIGMILFSAAICCLLLVVTLGGTSWPWRSSRCIGLFVGFGLIMVSFCYWLWKRGDVALIPLRVLRQRSIWTGALVLFGLGAASQTVRILPGWCPSILLPRRMIADDRILFLRDQYAYYLPIFFQAGQGISATQSGVRFIALVIPEIVAIGVFGGIVSKWGHYVRTSQPTQAE